MYKTHSMKKLYIFRRKAIALAFLFFPVIITSAQEKLTDSPELTPGFVKPMNYIQPVTNENSLISGPVQSKADLPVFTQKFSLEKTPLAEQTKIKVQQQRKAVQESGSLPVEKNGLKSAGSHTTAFCNDMPIGTIDQYVVPGDQTLSVAAPGFLANDIDLDGEALTATAILDNVNHGTLAAFGNGSFTYIPDADFAGIDTFVYRMRDASNNFSDSVRVTIDVLPPANRNPVGIDDRFAALAGTSLSIASPGFLANDIDPDGEILTATAILDNVNHGFLAAFGNGSFTYTPDADFTGIDTFFYRMRDASNNFSDSVMVAIEIFEGNRAPVGVDDQYTAVINTTLTIAAPGFLANDIDLDGEALTATAILDNVNHGTLAAFGNGSFTYIPDADFTGIDTFVYRMRDASNNFSDSITVGIEVSSGGTTPAGTPDHYVAPGDQTLSVAAPGFLANDIDQDGEALTATAILDNVNHGTLAAFGNGSFTYIPDADFTGIDTFVYRMRDASNNFSDSVRVTIDVLPPANRNPVGIDDRFAALAGTSLSIASPGFLANDIDPDGETLTATAILDNVNHGTLAAFGDGSFTYNPDADFTGIDTFVYRMRDASNNFSDSVMVTIEIFEGNRAPVGVDDKYTAVINTTLTIAAPGFLANDIDLDGEALTATAILENVNHGTLAAFGDGSFTYNPDADFTGIDTFVYRMRDASNNFADSVTVTIDVAAPNQPPVAVANDIVTECTGPTGTSVILDGSNSTDPEGGAITYTWYESGSIIAGPAVSPTAEVILSTGIYTVTLMVEDECGDMSSDDATITIEDTTAPVVEAAFLPANHPHEFEITCSSEDLCSDIVSSMSVILIPDVNNPSVSLNNNSNYSLVIDVKKKTVDVKAPDAAGFWAMVMSNGGVVVNKGQVISAKYDKNKYKFSFDSEGNLVSVEGNTVTLRCNAVDSHGNIGEGEATLPSDLLQSLAGEPELPSDMLKSVASEATGFSGDRMTGWHRNYPNPFKRITTIEYRLGKSAFVNITVFDQTGRTVEQLANKQMQEGVHEVTWNATQQKPGIYYYRIVYDGYQFSNKMILQP